MRESLKNNIGLKGEFVSNQRRIPTLTPCVGRCSTVFGDNVCRGCRRFSHEVIQWNGYGSAEQMAVWARLDAQLDQILLPMLTQANMQQVMQFIQSRRVKVLASASQGRLLYQALKICEKNKKLAEESGLGIRAAQVKPIWQGFEQRVLALANASYDFAWLRADSIKQNLLHWDDEETI